MGISTKGANVALHPTEGQVLILEAKVTRHHSILGGEESYKWDKNKRVYN